MNVLEKIFEEIKKRLNMVKNIPVNEEDDFLDGEECYENGRVQGRYEELVVCQEIIRSHMDEVENAEIEPVSKEFLKDCAETAKRYKRNIDGWIPVEDAEHTPENESYVLVSFSNFFLPDIARYEKNDEGGTYYPGDDEDSYLKYGFFVNAWMPLPELYREDIKTNEGSDGDV